MAKKYDSFRRAIRESVRRVRQPQFGPILDVFNAELESLADSGVVRLGKDHNLSDFGLEIRVKLLFREIGFDVARGRTGMEDLVVSPDEPLSPSKPLCIEVKSSRKSQIARSDLRQLDDWVFDLSGEEEARKRGLGGGGDPLAMITGGMRTRKKFHPSPHKGVLVFNGPVGTPFDQRFADWVGPNELDFADKRDFCIIPLQVLIIYAERADTDNSIRGLFWERIHSTSGVLSSKD